jgi:hypothetical protein
MMNQRIQELVRRADQYVKSNPKAGVTIHAGDMFNEKFAELIIRECVKAADEWYQYHNEIQWDPGEHIKQHFGVEE